MTYDRKWIGIGLLPLIIAVAACGKDGSAEPAEGGTAEETSRIINVETMTLQPQPFTEYVNLTGAVIADRDVVVSAEESGVVREIYVDKGASVKEGQPIARIDDRILRAQAEQAVAQADLAKETWQRQQKLWEGQHIGSEMAYIQARQGYLTAQANAKALSERLERTVIRAPIGGLIEDRRIEVGSMVSPGTQVARIVDLDPIKVMAGLPERYATQVAKNAGAEVFLPGIGQNFSGKVDFVGAAVDPQSRTVPAEIMVPNAGTRLRPGMVAEIRIERGENAQALVVPQGAILRSEDGYYVYVVEQRPEGGAVAEARPVTIGESQNGQVPVDTGLSAGEQVVVVGQKQVSAGDRVNIVGAEAQAHE